MKEKKKINVELFGQHILVYAPKIKEVTDSGIIKPQSQIADEQNKQDFWIEVAVVGPEVTNLVQGDKVLYSGNPKLIELDGEEYWLIYFGGVIGKKSINI